MKQAKRPFVLMLSMLFCCSSFCTAEVKKSIVNTNNQRDSTLIVYVSRTNNTKALAKIIQNKIGGILISLELKEPYPEDYQAIVDQVARENQTGYLPPLKTSINIDEFDTVFVGFPTWGMQLPPPMKSFLTKYDLSGKVVIPFNTNAGYGVGSSFRKVEELCPNSSLLTGFSTTGGIERDGIYFVMDGEKKENTEDQVHQWLQKIMKIK